MDTPVSFRPWFLLFLLSACAQGAYERGVYAQGKMRYKLGELPATWQRVQVEDANLTFRNKNGGAILVNSLCGSDHIDDVPLDVLLNQAIFGVENPRELERVPLTLDGRAAERARVLGALDGVPIELDMVVLKKDNCTFDFQLVGGPQEVEARRREFEGLFKGFAKLSPYEGKK
jgi:hypothetical protein